MPQMQITGPVKLSGTVKAQGSKNGLEPIMIASLLTDEQVTIHRVPNLSDTLVLIDILTALGKKIERRDDTIVITKATEMTSQVPIHLVEKMRASIITLGPLLARTGKAELTLPGGCSFGERPVDLHLQGMKNLGAQIHQQDTIITAEAKNGLTGATMMLSGHFGPTVLGTDNVMMAATLAKETTVIKDAAREPECIALADMLIEMGADISGQGSDTIIIKGVERLKGCEVTVLPDRIETISYLIAGIATGGKVTVEDTKPQHLESALDVLKNAGAHIVVNDHNITAKRGEMQPFNITTTPYPGIATDLQSLFAVLALTIPGDSTITDTIYPERFAYAHEMEKMGAEIKFREGGITIHGGKKLSPANLNATDLRAGAALPIAASLVIGDSTMGTIHHVLRGYENFIEKMNSLGAKISIK